MYINCVGNQKIKFNAHYVESEYKFDKPFSRSKIIKFAKRAQFAKKRAQFAKRRAQFAKKRTEFTKHPKYNFLELNFLSKIPVRFFDIKPDRTGSPKNQPEPEPDRNSGRLLGGCIAY